MFLPTLALAQVVRLGELPLDKVQQQWSTPKPDRSVQGHPLVIGGQAFDHGLGVHSHFSWWLDLSGKGQRFTASVGIDDEVRSDPYSAGARVEFKVFGDGKVLFDSGIMKAGDAPKPVDVNLAGVQTLMLQLASTTGSINYSHGDWADAKISYMGRRPVPIDAPKEPAEILTPKPPDTPRINGAKVFGVRPGHPVLYTIAATGDRPMTFTAEGLPAGLSLDPLSGQISGSVNAAGEYVVKLSASNVSGAGEATVRIKVGDAIALTPPMGWNSWNCFGTTVSDEKVRAAADAMVSSGLINHGWTYINMDDGWEVPASAPVDETRDSSGRIIANKSFPDMRALVDYIHSKGLRVGIYSSPGLSTCGGFTGSYGFEEPDAQQYANWGIDYLKYDWCSYASIADRIRKDPNPPSDNEILRQPYRVMRDALLKQNRDIFFSFCQYGIGNVWEWAAQAGANSWRTTGDISDDWAKVSEIGFGQAGHEKFAGPGHWNDPDMLVVGRVGWGHSLHQTHLSPNEQYSHISLWCLLSAPLLIGCDLTRLDDFTLGLLTNDEVLAVDQDPLGRQASRISVNGDIEVWAKDLQDGTKAVGIFNRGEMTQTAGVNWSDLGITGKQPVRDLWRQKDLGQCDVQFGSEVPRHGVMLIKIGTPH
jgi:alpha-galactosidase